MNNDVRVFLKSKSNLKELKKVISRVCKPKSLAFLAIWAQRTQLVLFLFGLNVLLIIHLFIYQIKGDKMGFSSRYSMFEYLFWKITILYRYKKISQWPTIPPVLRLIEEDNILEFFEKPLKLGHEYQPKCWKTYKACYRSFAICGWTRSQRGSYSK